MPEKLSAKTVCATEQESGDVLFLPSHERMANLSEKERMKLAFILSAGFAAHDVAFDLIAGVSQDKALEFLEAQELLPKVPAPKSQVPPPAGPPIPQIEHIKGEPVVSVVCATYNHVEFIEDAIKGFIAQKTCFPFEVIIHDDASTDGTQEVIKRYADQYPELIRPIYQKENQYSQNKRPLDHCLPVAKGKYIAICEGDDYWTDANKLKIQHDYMEKNPECVVTHHNAFVFNSEFLLEKSKLPEHCIRNFTSEELLKNECFLLSLSIMFRKKFSKFPKEKGNVGNGDNFLISLLGLYGNSCYLDEVRPAAYRVHPGSTWSSKSIEEKNKMLANSLYWIGKYHERKGRNDISCYYYTKSKMIE